MSYARVTLLPSQQVLAVEEHESILDAALRAGLNLPHSCKGGHCASCRARIIEGRVSYPMGRPVGLMAEEEARGYALLCEARAATADLTVEVKEIKPAAEVQVKSLPCRIERLQPLTPDVMGVFLRLPAIEQFTYVAGQYIDIILPQNRRRSFSIANPPHDESVVELHIRRVSNGEFTQQLFSGMKERTLLRIEGPLGQFWFRDDSPRGAVMIGGGTGYAPLRAMLRQLLERQDTRPLHLYWGGRTLVDLYEHELLVEWTRRHSNFRYTPVLSEPHNQPDWQGRTGFVHGAALADLADLTQVDVYASGPPAMVESVRHQFIDRGLPSEQLFFDSFDFAPDAVAKLRAEGSAPS